MNNTRYPTLPCPGYRCLHNLNYWNRGEYIGAGAGAHSFIQGVRSQNTGDIKMYINSLSNDIVPETEALEIGPEEALKEFIFLGLRKTGGDKLDAGHKYEAGLHKVIRRTSRERLSRDI